MIRRLSKEQGRDTQPAKHHRRSYSPIRSRPSGRWRNRSSSERPGRTPRSRSWPLSGRRPRPPRGRASPVRSPRSARRPRAAGWCWPRYRRSRYDWSSRSRPLPSARWRPDKEKFRVWTLRPVSVGSFWGEEAWKNFVLQIYSDWKENFSSGRIQQNTVSTLLTVSTLHTLKKQIAANMVKKTQLFKSFVHDRCSIKLLKTVLLSGSVFFVFLPWLRSGKLIYWSV